MRQGWPSLMSAMSFEPLKTYAPTVQAAVDKGSAAEADLAERQARLNEAEAEESARKEAEKQAKLVQIAQKEKEALLLTEQLAALKAEVA